MLKNIFNKNFSGVPIHTWLLLCIICLVGYWPISTNLFSLKNDAFVYFLPCRVFISESIQSGQLPLWSPYFYMGFPLHGDMQGGVWNPIVILISLFGKYNMTTLQYETLLYIFIAGLGIYKLIGITSSNHLTKLIIAVAYMFCGFIIDTGQITVWTGSAAFIPFVFLYYYRILYEREHIYKNVLKTSIALYFLFTAGYPSFLIMCCYVLFFSLLIFCISQGRKKNLTKKFVITLLKANTLLVIAFLLISLPALLSYIDYLPYYQRSSGTTLTAAQENPFNPFAVISYLFPLSVTRDHPYLSTDPTARSGYIGLFTIILLTGFFTKKIAGLQIVVLTVSLLIFLFSLGDALPVREFCYNYLPLMNLFRHPGTMRVFTTIGLLVLSSFCLDDLFIALKNKNITYYLWLCIASIALIGIVVVKYLNSTTLLRKVVSFTQSLSTSGNVRLFLKDFYAGFSFADAIVLEGVVQVFFLLVFLFILKQNGIAKTKWIATVFIINCVLLAQLSIPATFVTQQSPSKINNFLATTPTNYPLPDLNTTIADNNTIEKKSNYEYGCTSFYTKKIVQVDKKVNPSFTKNLAEFDNATSISSIVLKYPVCYFADTIVQYKDSSKLNTNGHKILFTDDSNGTTILKDIGIKSNLIDITKFAPWGLFFRTSTQQKRPFVLFQNYNKNWQLLIDGKKNPIKKGNISFMYADVEKGQHLLQFYYKPPYVAYSIVISLFTLLLIFLLINVKVVKLSKSVASYFRF